MKSFQDFLFLVGKAQEMVEVMSAYQMAWKWISMYSPLNTMSKLRPPFAGEGCRGATVLVYLRGTSHYWGRQGGKTEGGAAPQGDGDTATVGVSVCELL